MTEQSRKADGRKQGCVVRCAESDFRLFGSCGEVGIEGIYLNVGLLPVNQVGLTGFAAMRDKVVLRKAQH